MKQSFGAGEDKVGGRASVRASDKEGMWFDLFLKQTEIERMVVLVALCH